jgi:2-aminobenzoylacetyl-CoA thioesterase
LPHTKTGLIGKDFYVLGIPWSACHLLDGKRPVLFESGFTAAGRLYEEGIRQVLKEKKPEILFLSHVHYDHCGATDYLKKAFPGLKVAASERAAEILRRPHARELMEDLSRTAIDLVARADYADASKIIDVPFRPFEVDLVLKEGDIIDLDGVTVEVMATPGHTRDMLSYYIPERRLLVATESVGCQDRTGHIVSQFLVDYDAYLAASRRLAALPVDILCQGHHMVWVGKDEVQDFFARSIYAAESFREDVERLFREERGSVERVVARVKAAEYDTNPFTKQPPGAYVLNLTARVAHLAEKIR